MTLWPEFDDRRPGKHSPSDVYKLRAQCAHALDTIEEVLEALRRGGVNKVSKRASGGRPGMSLTCAVLGGKYSKDHQTRSSFAAFSIFWLIFMTVREV